MNSPDKKNQIEESILEESNPYLYDARVAGVDVNINTIHDESSVMVHVVGYNEKIPFLLNYIINRIP